MGPGIKKGALRKGKRLFLSLFIFRGPRLNSPQTEKPQVSEP